MANSIFLSNGLSSDAGGNSTTPGTITAGGAGGSFYAADGTAVLPAYSFSSEPTLGFRRSAPTVITLEGNLSVGGNLTTAALLTAANINATSGVYQAAGVAGVTTFGPAAVASITVKKGIITAIS